MIEQLKKKRAADEGFTLIELLIAIVVVGVLAAVVIVGIGSLADEGETAACSASADAATTAAVVHYANTGGTYPADVATMVTAGELKLPSGVATPAAGVMTVTTNGWTMTMTAAAPPTAPTFACS